VVANILDVIFLLSYIRPQGILLFLGEFLTEESVIFSSVFLFETALLDSYPPLAVFLLRFSKGIVISVSLRLSPPPL